MRVACLGGGPAGLYFAISMKLRDPSYEVVVIERNKPDDTFGWGVVLSDETLDNLAANDPVSAEAIRAHFAYWDDIAVYFRGTSAVSSGHSFCGIGRKRLLMLLQARARELGVEMRFETEIADVERYMAEFDLILAADGLNSITARPSPISSSPMSTSANVGSSGSARTRNSTTPSPSSSRKHATAGSGRTPTSSTPTPRPSSSNAPRKPSRSSASAR
jgi:2-polyprenyl-6-methoxyphenol hydroxylase-like FAD-dependent oxidoreductase